MKTKIDKKLDNLLNEFGEFCSGEELTFDNLVMLNVTRESIKQIIENEIFKVREEYGYR